MRIKDGARPFADRYSINSVAGQPVIISLTSANFDTYLYLFRPDGSALSQNDDSNSIKGGSSIPSGAGFLTFPLSGTFIIEVTAFSAQELGAYTLSLTAAAGGCSYAINSTNQSFAAGGGAGSVNVTALPACAWTAASNNSWIRLTTGGAAGNGSRAVNYSVAANSSPNPRSGSLTVAGLTAVVNQAGAGGANCPTVSGVNPPTAAIGSNVTITGANFTGVNEVRLILVLSVIRCSW